MSESQIQVKLNPDVEPTGSDLAVVNAARRSFNTRSEWEVVGYEDEILEGTRKIIGYPIKQLKEKDKRLIQFLARGMTADDFEDFVYDIDNVYYTEEGLIEKLWEWRNTPTHDTPFNHCFISFEVKAPIFVARHLVKSEYLIFSEFSRRYITDDVEFYEPDYWRKAAPNKKQGSLEEESGWPPEGTGSAYTLGYRYPSIMATYSRMVDAGVAPEQARMVLPQSMMTEWTWSGTLGAFAKMCQLRLHPEAQYETRLVAQQVYDYLKEYYPVSAKALVEGPDV